MHDVSETPTEDLVMEREGEPRPEALRMEPSPRWVRTVLGGVTVADSKRVVLLREARRLPVYYFPREDVRMDLLEPAGRRPDPVKGPATLWSVRAGARIAEKAAWAHEEPPAGHPELAGYVAFAWSSMDAWYEEDDEVYVHPRDPYHRVDVLHSSRTVRVVVLGETVAETRRPRLLFETGLPTRYYIPMRDVRTDLLVPSSTTSECPYKGVASYWSVRVADTLAKDMAWMYRFPVPECTKIEGLVCFFNERVDALYVDGELAAKPRTPWSGPPVLVKVEPASRAPDRRPTVTPRGEHSRAGRGWGDG